MNAPEVVIYVCDRCRRKIRSGRKIRGIKDQRLADAADVLCPHITRDVVVDDRREKPLVIHG